MCNAAEMMAWSIAFSDATFALPVEVAITKKMLDQTLDTSLYKIEWKRWCNGQTCSWVWLFSPGFKQYATLQLFCKKCHGFSLTLVRKTFKMFIYPVIPRATLGTRGFFSRTSGSLVSSPAGRRHERRSREKKPKPETAHEKPLAPRVSSSPNGLLVNSRRSHGLLTQRPWGRQE